MPRAMRKDRNANDRDDGLLEVAHGWATVEAAGLLNRSMLEWQASMSSSLASSVPRSSDGDLILAYANLGA